MCLLQRVGTLSCSLNGAIKINLFQPLGPVLNIFIFFDLSQCVTSGPLFFIVDFLNLISKSSVGFYKIELLDLNASHQQLLGQFLEISAYIRFT